MISYNEGSNKFNFRVGAIIKNKEKILIHRLKKFDFWLLPGGRVEMLEDTKEAILREIEEELGLKRDEELKDIRLKFINESFFDLNNQNYHEIAFNYEMELVSDRYNIMGEFNGIEGDNYIYKWVTPEELQNINIKPNYLKSQIIEKNFNISHIIKDERL